MESRDVLIIDQLRLRRGAREILRGVTFSARRGELLALMGLSGGGKTTVMRCVAALEPFDSGLISVDGVTLRAGPLPRSPLEHLTGGSKSGPDTCSSTRDPRPDHK